MSWVIFDLAIGPDYGQFRNVIIAASHLLGFVPAGQDHQLHYLQVLKYWSTLDWCTWYYAQYMMLVYL